ncbi:isochorismatase family protein [Modicisalibacter luteus]|uniref:Isochorismatase family protein n=1 Tax=Modicisalibacter luteus TaxID=453962 RepID=A0ABV7LZ13_9GAMM|nr:isochorismatase family protein [Halomonas lutea]GHB01710.1 isochorismatase [Halomonas lutea]
MSRLCGAARSVLILVDFQEGLLPVIQDGEAVVERAVLLAKAGKELGVPILGTEQNPEGLGANHPQIRQLSDQTFAKTYFDACSQPGFLSYLEPHRDELIIAGCEAHVCVLQTTLSLIEHGYRVRLVADAIGSRRSSDREVAIARAGAAGATVVTSEMVIFEWMRHSGHPSFRSVLALVK